MNRILTRSAIVALVSVLASLLATRSLVPALGGALDAGTLLLCTICPLAIAWPTSAYAFWQGEKLKKAHRELARTHAQLAAAHRRLEEKASRDDMTGLLNRESFFAVLECSRRKSDRGALLIIDADHFKTINDRFGHLAGDDALRLISSAIQRGLRSGDVLGRIGGEEFGALLVGTTAQEARHIAERVRREVESIGFSPEGTPVPLTVSIGGTICGQSATLAEIMRGADLRLYEAKHGGRNLVVVEPPTISQAA
ncbi:MULTISPECIES: GGDEF domain-containing protein [unclassified Mesorhizobium]|uniref:GGDEF domain-containing protein n=1 Tax=unclassified Mesorhizobium TaxID=325217 RepID=UPI0006F50A91|nr:MULTISPECIES: GGDEF domain-containing protein [unclassified Mesorhizobium]KQZ15447.1 diguanylate cyclase [Mesorhizobium sp. Root1471]KQZ37956.1 diguanylate cyclase [Mesorhizobium sp. Root554]MDR7033371.1 diguanylate cyclase (GGDEF)-like protein [Mesorhizobium sp. BE184]